MQPWTFLKKLTVSLVENGTKAKTERISEIFEFSSKSWDPSGLALVNNSLLS